MLGYDYKINGGVLKIRRNNPGKTLEKLLEEISKRKNISKIKEFNLQKCFIGRPIEEKYLEKFSHLTCINLSHNTFTDQSFKTFALHFEKLPQLTHLYLEHNHLGNSNLTVLAPHLEKLPNLKCISLRGNPKISAKNAEKLSTQLPNCLVEADSGAYKNGKKIDNILSSGQQAESVEGLSTQLPNCLVEAESEAYKNGKISNTLPSSQQAESYAYACLGVAAIIAVAGTALLATDNLKRINLRGNPNISNASAEKLSNQPQNCITEAESEAYKNGKK